MELMLAYIGIGILFARCADKMHAEEDEALGSLFLIGLFWLPIMFTIAIFGKEKGD